MCEVVAAEASDTDDDGRVDSPDGYKFPRVAAGTVVMLSLLLFVFEFLASSFKISLYR